MKPLLKIIISILFISTLAASCTNKSQGSFYHVLMIEYANEANMKEITEEVLLFKNIPAVIDIQFGKIIENPKNKIQNFSYCLVLEFKDKQGLKEYLKAPYHQKIYQKHKPLITNIYTADFNSFSLNN